MFFLFFFASKVASLSPISSLRLPACRHKLTRPSTSPSALSLPRGETHFCHHRIAFSLHRPARRRSMGRIRRISTEERALPRSLSTRATRAVPALIPRPRSIARGGRASAVRGGKGARWSYFLLRGRNGNATVMSRAPSS